MGQVIADIFTISISGFLNLRNALIDYLINPLDFDSLLSEIRKKILQTVPINKRIAQLNSRVPITISDLIDK